MAATEPSSLAYGHLRNAASHYLFAADDTGESLFLGAACLDVEDAFEQAAIVPAFVEDRLSAEGALVAALACLDEGAGPLVPMLREALVDLAIRAGVQ